jgi:hypothetical protein
MKHLTGYISRLTVLSILLNLIACLVLTHNATAQKLKPKVIVVSPAPGVYWHAEFTLSIVGKGTNIRDDGATEDEWIINRKYLGFFGLNSVQFAANPPWISKEDYPTPREIKEAVLARRYTNYTYSARGIAQRLHVNIHDAIAVRIMDRGEGNSFEKTNELKVWKMDEVLDVIDEATVTVDNRSKTFSVVIGFALLNKQPRVNLRHIKTVTRSSFGYGDAPTADPPIDKTSLVEMKYCGIPSAGRLLRECSIQTPYRPLPAGNEELVIDIPDLKPDDPMIPGIPESKTDVKIQLIIKITKTFK